MPSLTAPQPCFILLRVRRDPPAGPLTHSCRLGILVSLLTETYPCLGHTSLVFSLLTCGFLSNLAEFMNHSHFKVLFHFSIHPCNIYSNGRGNVIARVCLHVCIHVDVSTHADTCGGQGLMSGCLL